VTEEVRGVVSLVAVLKLFNRHAQLRENAAFDAIQSRLDGNLSNPRVGVIEKYKRHTIAVHIATKLNPMIWFLECAM
jgi:hypothetical protein